jgi:hypothetical protein
MLSTCEYALRFALNPQRHYTAVSPKFKEPGPAKLPISREKWYPTTMKKIFGPVWFALSGLLALAAVGCGDKQEQSKEDAAPPNVEGGPVESGAGAQFSTPNTD